MENENEMLEKIFCICCFLLRYLFFISTPFGNCEMLESKRNVLEYHEEQIKIGACAVDPNIEAVLLSL